MVRCWPWKSAGVGRRDEPWPLPGGRGGGREGGALCGSSGLLPHPSTTKCPLGPFLFSLKKKNRQCPSLGASFFAVPFSGALSGAAGQHQFLGLEEGDRREGRSCGGGLLLSPFDCYSPAPLLSRPGQTEDGSPFFWTTLLLGGRFFYFPFYLLLLVLSWDQAEGGDLRPAQAGGGSDHKYSGGSRC